MQRKTKIILGLAGTGSLALLAAISFLDDGNPKPQTIVSVAKRPASVDRPKAAAVKQTIETEKEDDFNPYESEVLKANLQQVADVFEETSKYPASSQPVYDPAAVQEPEPFEFTEVDQPFPKDKDDKTPIRISAATDTYQYFAGDTIQARVRISGGPEDSFVSVKGVLSGLRGDVPSAINFEPRGDSLTEFYASIDTNLLPAEFLTPEMILKLTVNVDNRDLFTTTTLRFDQPSAQIIGLLPSRVDGPNLVVPLQVNVIQGGYYFVRSVLEDAATRQPLVELQNEQPLQSGNAIINLNAHIAALKRQGSEGPYILRSVRLHRGAEIGEALDAPGNSLQRQYTVQGFPFTAYSDEPYVDPIAQERLEFLRDLGGVDQDQVRENLRQAEERERLERENPSLAGQEPSASQEPAEIE